MTADIDLMQLVEQFAAREKMSIEYTDYDVYAYILTWTSFSGRICQIRILCDYGAGEHELSLGARVQRYQSCPVFAALGFPFAVMLELEGLGRAHEMLHDARLACEQLAELLASDGKIDVRRSMEGLGSKDGLTRYVAALALSATPPEVRLPGLGHYLEHEDPVVRSHTAWLVGQRGCVRDRAMLARMLSDPDPIVRCTVERTLSLGSFDVGLG